MCGLRCVVLMVLGCTSLPNNLYFWTLNVFTLNSVRHCKVGSIIDSISHSKHVISGKQVETLIWHTTMCRNSINFLYNPGHVTLWYLEVVSVIYARVIQWYTGFPVFFSHKIPGYFQVLSRSKRPLSRL